MTHTRRRAFTLIELLAVIAIIAILAIVVAANAGPFMKNAQMLQAVNNMKQVGAGILNYAASHDSELPRQGELHPVFGGGAANDPQFWYNEPIKLAGGRALSEITNAAEFYQKSNPLFVPGAKYPDRLTPHFGMALNGSLRSSPDGTELPAHAVRMPNFQQAARTILLLETGVTGEPTLPGQPAYTGGSTGGPSTVVARYKRPTTTKAELLRESPVNLLFADGHAEAMPAKNVITNAGLGYFPQLGEGGNDGRVCWTLDPEAQPLP